jgi:hypothetical protein
MVIVASIYFFLLMAFAVFSFGFVDLNLVLSANPLYVRFHVPLSALVYHNRPAASVIFLIILISLFICYLMFMRSDGVKFFSSGKRLSAVLLFTSLILVFSYPALTYDLFNYITTAKVIFTHHENPYVVMPIEIPNEPYLAFTRAANKYALYGPVWILLTAIPHYLGRGSIWMTIIMFKSLNAVGYLLFSYLIFRITRSIRNVLFFAFNPLVLIEILVSGHNDIFMMLFGLLGLFLWKKKKNLSRLVGLVLFFTSWWVKGATLILSPLLLFKNISFEKMLKWAFWLLMVIFFVVAPIREELYPWYAVWLITTASLLSFKTSRIIVGFTVVLSFALELRHLPYMWMGYYEGPGPMLRLIFTAIPILAYVLFVIYKKYTYLKE